MTFFPQNVSVQNSQLLGQILIDRYQIQSLLSQNAGRRTYIAQDQQTGKTVVIKLLLFGVDFGWDDLKLFEREAAVLKSLDHAAIPRYLDYFGMETEFGQGFALVQTYIESQSLQDWVQSGRTFDEAQLRSIARNLLEILDYLHHRQPAVIHRDIKPSNILLGDRSGHSPGQVYLVDFGSVQTAINTTGTMTIVGTYGYMPPEQFGGQTSPASDLYALGATLIYLATGQHPTELPQKEMRILFEQQISLSPNLTMWLKSLTETGLENRVSSAQQALATLDCPNLSAYQHSPGLLTQPIGSKVQMQNTDTELRIVLPNNFNKLVQDEFMRRLEISTATVMGAAFVIQVLYEVLHVLPEPFFKFLQLGIFLPPVILFSGKAIWLWIVRDELRLTKDQIISECQLGGQTIWRSNSARRLDISQIEITDNRYQYIEKGNYMVKISTAQVNIWAGVKKFTIGKNLTKPELEWLAQACSVRLNIPITRENRNSQ